MQGESGPAPSTETRMLHGSRVSQSYMIQAHDCRAAHGQRSPIIASPSLPKRSRRAHQSRAIPCLRTQSADTLLIETPGYIRLSALSCFCPVRSQEADPYCFRVVFYSGGTYWYEASLPNLCGCRHQQGYTGAILSSWT